MGEVVYIKKLKVSCGSIAPVAAWYCLRVNATTDLKLVFRSGNSRVLLGVTKSSIR
jgi:hypothetical protein